MKYHVLVAGAHHEVSVEPDGGGYRLVLQGRSFHVDVGVLSEGRAWSLLIDDRSVDVAVEEHAGGQLELLIGGRRYGTEVLGEREWQARSIQVERPDGDKTVRAIMTGIVRDVLVAEGDRVARGQTLLILEAMKMENEVKAAAAGTVARLAVATGSTVTLGDIVVELA